MKAVSLLLLLTVLSACAAAPQKEAGSTPPPASGPTPVAENGTPVTIVPMAKVEPKLVVPAVDSEPAPASQFAAGKTENFWADLNQNFSTWAVSLNKFLSISCSQDAGGRP